MSKKLLLYLISIIVLIAISVIIWLNMPYIYKTNNDPSQLPIIKAPTKKIKTKPESPGGTKILNMDKNIYNLFSKNKNTNPVKEYILPAPEDPILNIIEPNLEKID